MHAAIELLNVAGNGFLRLAAAMLLQSSILILLLLGLDLVLRTRVRAVLRYWMWTLVLVKLVLPPSLGLPTGIAWWLGGRFDPAPRLAPAAASPPNVAKASVMAADPESPPQASPAQSPSRFSLDAAARHVAWPVPPPPHSPVVPPVHVAQTPVSVVSPVAPASLPPLHWPAVLLLVYGTALAILALAVLRRAGRVRNLVRQGRPAEPALLAILAECRQTLAPGRRVDLRISPRLVSPAVSGLLHPTILVPEYLPAELDEKHLRAILLHELAHVQRHDIWVSLVQTLLMVVYFYNPLLWLANAMLHGVREQAVDEAVLVAMGEQARQYPETLVAVARLALARPAFSLRLLGVVESRSALSGRVKHILGRPIPKSARLSTIGLAALTLLAMALLPMATRHPQDRAAAAGGSSSQPATQSAARPAAPSASPDKPVASAPAPATQPAGIADLAIEDMPEEFVDSSMYQGLGTLPSPTTRPAFCKSDKPLSWQQKNGAYVSALLFDESGGTGTGYDTLYVDVTGQKGFQADTPVYKADAPLVAAGAPVIAFRNVLVQRPGKDQLRLIAKITLMGQRNKPDAPLHYNGRLCPQKWARGTINLAGKPIAVGLLDLNRNGRFTDRGNADSGMQITGAIRCDFLVMAPVSTQSARQSWIGALKLPLTQFLVLNSGTYRVTATDVPDKVHLQIEPVAIPGAKIDPVPQTSDGHLELIGDKTLVFLNGVKDTLALPADNYRPLVRHGSPLTVTAQEGILVGLPLGKEGATQDAFRVFKLRIQTVRTEDSKPLASATVNVEAYTGSSSSTPEYTTNEQGECVAILPPSGIDTLRIKCRSTGRVPMAVRWDSPQLATLPQPFVFQLEPGTTIGGIIRNEEGEPIAGAAVHVLLPSRNSSGETYADISDHVFHTDKQGRWKCDYAPSEINDIWLRLEHQDYVSDNMFGVTPKPPIEKLRDQTGEMVMKRGLTVTGIVVNSDGKPIAGASVKQGRDRFGSNYSDVKTDEQGKFTFSNANPGQIILTTTAIGMAPDVREADAGPKMEPVRIELQPGRKLTVRVVDSKGKPIPQVWAVADTWRSYRSLEWRTNTDANGRFVWDEAPADEVLFDMGKQGYMSVRGHALTASDEEQTVTMVAPLQITGTVVDAATSQPLGEFQVLQGIDWRNQSPVYWQRDSAKPFRNGRYDVTFEYPYPSHLLRVEAPGYTPAVSRAFNSNEGQQTFNFALEPGKGLTGTLLDAEGKPVPKANILIATPSQQVMIQNGRSQQNRDAIRLLTDDAGHFKLPVQTDTYALVVLDDKGFAQVSQSDFEASHEIRLAPWARVEGVLRIGSKPGAGQQVAMFYQDIYRPEAPRVFRSYNVATDSDGRFVFERAMPGEASVGREISQSNTSRTYTNQQQIDVKPGKTVQVTIGGQGRPVIGKIRVPKDYDKKIDWHYVMAHAVAREPRLDAVNTWLGALSQSDAAKARSRNRSFFSFAVSDDGSFRIDDVPAGTYQLQVDVCEPPSSRQPGFGQRFGRVEAEFTVAEMEGGRSDEPQDLGDLGLMVAGQLKAVQAAPSFEVPSLDGQSTLKLADMRGKYVLLDFWATWCGPCRAETPNLKAVYDKFGKDPRFMMVSLSLDPDQKEPKEYAEKEKMSWLQGFLGDWSKAKLPDEYGVEGIPAIFLIGPDGWIVAKNLRGPAILSAVQTALGSPGTESPPATQSTRPVSGIIVDPAGFPVSNARVAVAETGDLWNGARTNSDGRFILENTPPDAKAIIAHSQKSSRIAVFPIAAFKAADARHELDCQETQAQGWVMDSKGNAIKRAEVTFHVTGPGGISYTHKSTTDSDGSVGWEPFPAGPGWKVSASLSSGESTEPVAMPDQATVELPDLVQQAPATQPSGRRAPLLVTYSGRVVDEDGKPIAGAILEVITQEGVGLKTECTAITDKNGRWSRRLPAKLANPEIRLSHPEFVGYQFDLRQPTPPASALRDGSAVQTMTRGMRVAGTIKDPSGKPVGNALVASGMFYSSTSGERIEDCATTRTKPDGTFTLSCIPSGSQSILVTTDSFAPAKVFFVATPDMKPLVIVLERGRTVSGRIVDEEAKPMANVEVVIDDWTMANAYRERVGRSARSGPDGRFIVSSLPRQGLISGYVHVRGRLGIDFEIHPGSDDLGDIPIYPLPVINGRVVDGDTGEPLASFDVTSGSLVDDDKPHWHWLWQYGGTSKGKNGIFKTRVDSTSISRERNIRFLAKITALGYAPALTPTVEPGKKHEPFLIKMRKSPPFTAKVLAPDKSPAGGALVVFVGPENDTIVVGTGIHDNAFYAPDLRTTAKKDGQFQLPASGEDGRLLILHDAGYAIVATNDFKADQEIALTPWARIEGTYCPGGKRRANVQVWSEAIRPKSAYESRDRMSFQLSATTDAAGRFVIEHVPAMQLRVGAWASFGPSASTMIQPQEGKTIRVALPEDGPAVTGKVDLAPAIAANPPAPGMKFDTSTSWIRAVRVEPRPDMPDGVDKADWQSQIDSVLDGTASDLLTLPATFANLQPDGSFAFDALAPGKYVLLVDIHGQRPPGTCGWGVMLGKGRIDFTVQDKPVTIGPIALKATVHPGVGSQSPEVAGKTPSGETFALSKLRGKYVVLDFWAGWCAPCRASQPALKAIHEKYQGKVAFVGLNFDYTDARAKQAIEAIKSPWPQVLLGPWGGNNTTLIAYGVEVIPSLWLIDPEGKVAAKDLTPDDLERQLSHVAGGLAGRLDPDETTRSR